MNALKNLTMFVAALAVLLVAQAAHAQVRDAGSKVQGNYNFYTPGPTAGRMSQGRVYVAPAPIATAAAPSTSRSYSYSAAPAQPGCAATAAETPDMPAMSKRPATSNRTFSYQPAAPVNRPSAVAGSPVRSGAERNAAAKVLGQY